MQEKIIMIPISEERLKEIFEEVVWKFANENLNIPYNNSKSFLTLEETAKLLDCSESKIYKLTSKNEIPHIKKGGKLYFSKNDIENWLFDSKVSTINENVNNILKRKK